MSAPAKPYPEASSSPKFPALEEEILKWWEEEKIFERSIEQRRKAGAPEFVFYDGPPFANGLPHYGHLVTSFIKDVIPRFQTMRGKTVDRRFGWDCHGLPAELHSEKELKLSGRQSIIDYGIERFNAHCETSVMQFTDDWEYYVRRAARWVDFENSYKTMDRDFMESVMWAFKTLHERGLVYEGYRVVPYSWAVQTPLSNFETRLDNAYRQRQDPALTVAFTLQPAADDDAGSLKLAAWTTTPWTLPSNLALAVNPSIDYALMRKGDETLIFAADAVERYKKELGAYEQVGTIEGRALVGRRYRPLFDFFASTENAFQVIAGDFIEASEGTGVVHIAPAFGEDDMIVAEAAGIPVVDPVDAAGDFTAQVPPYQGLNVFAANKPIAKDLARNGVVIRHETYDHNYPHCWRTDEPLIYKAVRSWYVKVSAFRDRMVELNRDTVWVPGHIRDGLFGKWLENARDWNIGRNRFWGAAIPVWKSDNPEFPRLDVYGSLDELERDFGVRPENLHRPHIDNLTRPNPDDPSGKSTMRRVEDVLDCWFESGSMTFAQVHYPFENKEWFDAHFPGDFITEYLAQTRGWFYTLMVMSTALFDRAPFRSCLCHGVVLDEDRQKLSKRLLNYPDPVDVFNTYGADALRWYMVSSPLMSGGDLAMPKDGRAISETVRKVLLPLWNAYYFFTLYANLDGAKAKMIETADGELDRYILSKTGQFSDEVAARLERLDVAGACNAFPPMIEALNNWYIRRSRERFWSAEVDASKQDAFDTLYTVLVTMTRSLAPLLPMVSENIHRALCDGESVHLADYPSSANFKVDEALVERMDLVQELCSAAQSIREAKRLRTRLPLRALTIAHSDHAKLAPFAHLIAEEVNVKDVRFVDDPAQFGALELAVDRRIGKRIGAKMKDVLKAAPAGDWTQNEDGTIDIAGVTLASDEFDLRFKATDGIDAASFAGWSGVAVLDTETDADLEAEGRARDLVRLIQTERKNAGLDVADRIATEVRSAEALIRDFETHRATVAQETLSDELRFIEDAQADGLAVAGGKVAIAIKRKAA
ncbi:MAG: isoleucine--tRNA ligase [Pseudomonadota bacterium]